jgi:hypothetical protein
MEYPYNLNYNFNNELGINELSDIYESDNNTIYNIENDMLNSINEDFTDIVKDNSLEINKWALKNNFKYNTVNGDGGCQFYAFSCAYQKILKNNNIKNEIIETLVNNQIKKNTAEIRNLILALSEIYIYGYSTDTKIKSEVDQLYDITEWGNHYSLILLANFYNVNIIIYEFRNIDDVRKYKINVKSSNEINLIRINQNHYDWLEK